MIKVLAIGDTADNIFSLKKYAINLKIHLINFPRKKAALMTVSKKDVEFFNSLLISKQVEHIKKIKDQYDLCIVMSWAGARVAYLAGINYSMYFVGGDITNPPFIKNTKPNYLKTPVHNKNFIERLFYKKVLQTAIVCIGAPGEYEDLKIYRNDAIKMERVFVDTEFFNENIEPKKIEKKKFTFLSAQRLGKEKGIDLLWKAISLCKTDFEILQVKWFIETNPEENLINEKLIKEMPSRVRFIPLIKREEVGSYFKAVDAIMGQFRTGWYGGIERDAVYCKKPVICYIDLTKPKVLEQNPPFLPISNKPEEIAKIIDKVVESEEFRTDLMEREYKFVNELCEPKKVTKDWEEIFIKLHKTHSNINRKESSIINIINNFVARMAEKFIYSRTMKEKNIQAWGQDEYNKLMK
jgi:glycosyltransferase involved in cell wall biosynthesis